MLYSEAVPSTSSHYAARMQELLSFRFGKANLQADFDSFDLALTRYEVQTRQQLPENLKTAIVTRGLEDSAFRQHVLFHAGRLDTYESMKSELVAVEFASAGLRATLPTARGTSARTAGTSPHGRV